MIKDTSIIKENIIKFLETNGPSLPVHIAKNIGLDMLFTSAFLSELMNQQKIRSSFMKVGTSPIYFLPEQEKGLEKFSEYLKQKEKEAYILLKEKTFLIDSNQEAPIRIALRTIKDFAKNFEKEGKIIWRYFTISEKEYEKKEIQNKNFPKEIKEEIQNPPYPEKTKKEIEYTITTQNTKEKINEDLKKKKKITKTKNPSKKNQDKKNERFFNKVKEYLNQKEIKLTDIIGFNKQGLTLKIEFEGKEKILLAFNKKRIVEEDIILAHKKAQEFNLRYIILSLGEPAKKTQNLIEAIKKLDSFEKIE